jgi:hypothetical protein
MESVILIHMVKWMLLLNNDWYIFIFIMMSGLMCAEAIKNEFDQRWSPHWHVVIGRNFGSYVTHETKHFLFFYLDDKAVMMFKAG